MDKPILQTLTPRSATWPHTKQITQNKHAKLTGVVWNKSDAKLMLHKCPGPQSVSEYEDNPDKSDLKTTTATTDWDCFRVLVNCCIHNYVVIVAPLKLGWDCTCAAHFLQKPKYGHIVFPTIHATAWCTHSQRPRNSVWIKLFALEFTVTELTHKKRVPSYSNQYL